MSNKLKFSPCFSALSLMPYSDLNLSTLILSVPIVTSRSFGTDFFKTYEKDEEGKLKVKKVYGEIGYFWSYNKDISIIPSLFYSKEYSSSDYDNARNNVLY